MQRQLKQFPAWFYLVARQRLKQFLVWSYTGALPGQGQVEYLWLLMVIVFIIMAALFALGWALYALWDDMMQMTPFG